MGLLNHPFWLQLVLAISDHHFQLLNLFDFLFVWPRITDEGKLPEMRIWSILLIKSDLKWCIHLSRSLFLYSSKTYLRDIRRCSGYHARYSTCYIAADTDDFVRTDREEGFRRVGRNRKFHRYRSRVFIPFGLYVEEEFKYSTTCKAVFRTVVVKRKCEVCRLLQKRYCHFMIHVYNKTWIYKWCSSGTPI